MASMAKIQIIGNVGRDPEMRMTPQGRPVCDFSVAVNRVQNSGLTRRRVKFKIRNQTGFIKTWRFFEFLTEHVE